MGILNEIRSPADLRKLDYNQLNTLADELRAEVIRDVSVTGGHLASNLGVVELTLALHRVFDCPREQIVFDVGHQTYVHKILTGRRDRMHTLRQKGGLSGFMSRAESEYDSFGGGHSGTALSAAIGMAVANALNGSEDYVVAVIGDGSFTNGMVYEALNNLEDKKRLKLMIVLNDNEMSISKNVGGLSRHFADMRTTQGYFLFKRRIFEFLTSIPVIGDGVYRFAKWVKDVNKKLLLHRSLFDDFGIEYLGPIDGRDIKRMETVFREVRRLGDVTVVHVCTKKGSGYEHAENAPDVYHSVSSFSVDDGYREPDGHSFSGQFGGALCTLARRDRRICAVTAAMEVGTGLKHFAQSFPDRFFDVGIAEAHAVTFCAGLAVNGKLPYFAVYSSFLQRAYDQLIHDVAIQSLPCVFCVDRAGFVPGDGVTHQGIFDAAFLNQIPNVAVYSPENYDDLARVLVESTQTKSPLVIRYPKGEELEYDRSPFVPGDGGAFAVAEFGDVSAPTDCVAVTYGRVCKNVVQAASAAGGHVRVIRLLRIKPLPVDALCAQIEGARRLLLVEEGVRAGGVCETLLDRLCARGLLRDCAVTLRAVDDRFSGNGTVDELYCDAGMDARSLCAAMRSDASERAAKAVGQTV